MAHNQPESCKHSFLIRCTPMPELALPHLLPPCKTASKPAFIYSQVLQNSFPLSSPDSLYTRAPSLLGCRCLCLPHLARLLVAQIARSRPWSLSWLAYGSVNPFLQKNFWPWKLLFNRIIHCLSFLVYLQFYRNLSTVQKAWHSGINGPKFLEFRPFEKRRALRALVIKPH